MKPVIFLSAACLLLAACHPATDKSCKLPIPAAALGLTFRVLDKTTGNDLLLTPGSGLAAGSLLAIQPCHADTVRPMYEQYTVPGSSEQAKILSFINLRNPAPAEGSDCFTIYLHWSASDVDTVTWHYHIRPDGNCEYQVIDLVSFNGIVVDKVDLHLFSYYPLLK